LKVTMYDTGGPVGAASVVVEPVEVVPYCDAAGEVSAAVVVESVVAVSVEVEAESVVVAVLSEGALLPVEVESLLVVESVLLEPVKTLTAPPSGSLGSATAPEANTPSKSSAARPATSLAVWPHHFDSFPPIPQSSLFTTVRASPDRSNANDGVRPRRSGQARTDRLSAVPSPQLSPASFRRPNLLDSHMLMGIRTNNNWSKGLTRLDLRPVEKWGKRSGS
jgi:hypothetical protein